MHTMHSVQVKEGKKAGMVSEKYTTTAREQNLEPSAWTERGWVK